MKKLICMMLAVCILVALAACGAENDLPVLIRPGMKLHCSACGTELEI